jgi:hypothetical protein
VDCGGCYAYAKEFEFSIQETTNKNGWAPRWSVNCKKKWVHIAGEVWSMALSQSRVTSIGHIILQSGEDDLWYNKKTKKYGLCQGSCECKLHKPSVRDGGVMTIKWKGNRGWKNNVKNLTHVLFDSVFWGTLSLSVKVGWERSF